MNLRLSNPGPYTFHCPAYLLAHDGDWFVARISLGMVEALDELQDSCGVGRTAVLRPLVIVELGHHKPLPLSLKGRGR